MATTLWPAAGPILGVTNVTAFSFQSVMTLAKAGGATTITAAAVSSLRILACILRSSGCRQFRVGGLAASPCRGACLRYMSLRDRPSARVAAAIGRQPITGYEL